MSDDLSNVNENDDLSLSSEDDLSVGNESQDTNAASGFKLQADGQYGLKYIPEIEQTGIYSFLLDGSSYESSNSNAKRRSAKGSLAISSSASSKNDIYGIVEPTPLQERASDVTTLGKERSESTTSQNKSINTRGNGDFSLEQLYERKRIERMEHGEEEYVSAKRTELPERPFWDNVLKPFASIGTNIRLGFVAAVTFIPCFLVTYFFMRTLSADVQTMLHNQQGLSALTAFLRCIWEDKVIFLMFCFLWGVFSTPYSFHIFTETASGADKFEDWPEYSFLGGLGQFLWVALLTIIAGIPGVILFSLLGLPSTVGFTFSAAFLTPIFFLSYMQADALFTLITKNVVQSLKNVYKSWGYFFGITYAFIFGTIALGLFTIWLAVHNYVAPNIGEKPSLLKAVFPALIFSVALSYIPALYARFLGRLAWIIEDDITKRLQEEEEGEDSTIDD